jgi:hypothetical protein
MALIKTIGNSGQICLGKKFAGQTVMLDEVETGVWILKVGRFIPDSEKWLHTPDAQAELDEAIAWAEGNPPEETDFRDLESRMES